MLGATGSQDTTEENGSVVDAPPFGQHAISNLPSLPGPQSHLPSCLPLEDDGYDSDAGVDRYVAICLEGPQKLDKAEVPEVGDDTSASNSGGQGEHGGQAVDIPPAKLAKLKVSELKQELAKRGQPVNGLKAVLLESLKTALQQRLPLLSQADQAAHATDDLKGFSPTAQGRLLQQVAHMVKEPQNVVPLHAPTVPEEDVAFVPPKHDFAETFDHAPFIEPAKFPKLHHSSHPVVVDGKQQ